MRLGERESGIQHLTEAMTAYRAALQSSALPARAIVRTINAPIGTVA
jgi:hypothetical protein